MDATAPQDAPGLARWLEGLRLPTTRLREGYEVSDVDAFLAGVRDDLVRQVPLDRGRVDGAVFRPTRLSTGYAMGATDAALAQLAQRLDGLRAPSASPSGDVADRPVADPGLAAWVAGLRFATTEWTRQGYDQQQVDRLLAGVRADLEGPGPPPDPGRVRAPTLDRVRATPGYDVAAVDAALAELAVRLDAVAGAGPVAAARPSPPSPTSPHAATRSLVLLLLLTVLALGAIVALELLT